MMDPVTNKCARVQAVRRFQIYMTSGCGEPAEEPAELGWNEPKSEGPGTLKLPQEVGHQPRFCGQIRCLRDGKFPFVFQFCFCLHVSFCHQANRAAPNWWLGLVARRYTPNRKLLPTWVQVRIYLKCPTDVKGFLDKLQ